MHDGGGGEADGSCGGDMEKQQEGLEAPPTGHPVPCLVSWFAFLCFLISLLWGI